jgi:hypothetical protein
VRWVGLRLLLLAPVVGWAAAGGPYLALLMWALMGYLVFRAWPGVVADVRAARRVLRVRGGRYSVRGGEL